MESEKNTEIYLRKTIEALGGKCYKWTSPMVRGVPDRICFLPGVVFFAEIKSQGRKLGGAQIRRARELEELGQRCYCVDTKAAVNQMIKKEINHDKTSAEGPE